MGYPGSRSSPTHVGPPVPTYTAPHLLNGRNPSHFPSLPSATQDPDAEHPTVIFLYIFIAPQAPSGPTGLKVNPLLSEIYMNIHWTWLLPPHGTLCIIRYEGNRHQAARKLPGGQGEGPQDPRADRKHQDEEKEACRNCTTGQSGLHSGQSDHTKIALPDSPVPTADNSVAHENVSVLTGLFGPYHRTVQ